MLIEPTIEKLKAMRLDAMASLWREQASKLDFHQLAFDERFGMLVDAEWLHRENKRIATALRDAKLRLTSACVEDLEEISPLVVGDRRHREVVDHEHVRPSDLGEEARVGSAGPREHELRKQAGGASVDRTVALAACLLGECAGDVRLAGPGRAGDQHVLVFNDPAAGCELADLGPIELAMGRIVDVLDDRHGTRSTIISSQVPYKRFHDYINESTHADAIGDRLIHGAHKLVLRDRPGAAPRSPPRNRSNQSPSDTEWCLGCLVASSHRPSTGDILVDRDRGPFVPIGL
jgi:hypothetical protein